MVFDGIRRSQSRVAALAHADSNFAPTTIGILLKQPTMRRCATAEPHHDKTAPTVIQQPPTSTADRIQIVSCSVTEVGHAHGRHPD